jgi:coenzyme PQQ synthesis protein D (PqqD)
MDGSTNLHPALKFKLSRQARLTLGRDGAIVLQIQLGEVFSLNPLGTRILTLLQEGHAEPDIVNSLCVEYPEEARAIPRDVFEFVQLLERLQVVEREQAVQPIAKGSEQ